MGYKIARVGTISRRTDETVRFPVFGTLDSDYLITDEQNHEAGKARVEEGVITVLGVRTDIVGEDREKILDLMLRSIVSDADNKNANLSIEITPDGEGPQDMKRFFERFGFRTTMGNIMKRVAGSIHPATVKESEF